MISDGLSKGAKQLETIGLPTKRKHIAVAPDLLMNMILWMQTRWLQNWYLQFKKILLFCTSLCAVNVVVSPGRRSPQQG